MSVGERFIRRRPFSSIFERSEEKVSTAMVKLHTQYIVDTKGRRRAVQLPFHEFRHLIDLIEDLEDLAYLKAHRHDKLIPMAKVHASLKRPAAV